jgi:hypothetical protein
VVAGAGGEGGKGFAEGFVAGEEADAVGGVCGSEPAAVVEEPVACDPVVKKLNCKRSIFYAATVRVVETKRIEVCILVLR